MSNTISRVLYQNNHLSRPDVAIKLKQPTRDTTGSRIISVRSCFGWGLHSHFCYQKRGELLPRLFTLTCINRRLFSVALAWESPPPDVIRHPALWSPDFPHLQPFGICSRDCLCYSLPKYFIMSKEKCKYLLSCSQISIRHIPTPKFHLPLLHEFQDNQSILPLWNYHCKSVFCPSS